MKNEKNTPVILWVGCFVLIFIFRLAFGTLQYFVAKGTQTQVFNMEQLELCALKPDNNGGYIATDGDPSVLIEMPMKVCNITFTMDSYVPTGEVVAFYKTDGGSDYSMKNMAAAQKFYEKYVIELGALPKKVAGVRIDPTIVGGNRLYMGQIVINDKLPLSHYLRCNGYDLFTIFAMASFVSCGAMYVLKMKK